MAERSSELGFVSDILQYLQCLVQSDVQLTGLYLIHCCWQGGREGNIFQPKIPSSVRGAELKSVRLWYWPGYWRYKSDINAVVVLLRRADWLRLQDTLGGGEGQSLPTAAPLTPPPPFSLSLSLSLSLGKNISGQQKIFCSTGKYLAECSPDWSSPTVLCLTQPGGGETLWLRALDWVSQPARATDPPVWLPYRDKSSSP